MTYIQAGLLIVAGCLYAGHACLAIMGWRRQRGADGYRRWALVVFAIIFHACFLIMRILHIRGMPIETRLDSVTSFLLVVAIIFALFSRPYRLQGVAALFWPVYAISAIGTWLLASGAPMDRPSLEKTWLLLHLVPVYAGYACFTVAAFMGLAYIAQNRFLRSKGSEALWRKLPSLEKLDHAGRYAVSLGFPALTIGLVVGALWAEHRLALLGKAWYADPKVAAGILVWLVYAVVLHIRLFAKVRGRQAALLTIAGFLLTLATFAAAHVYPPA